MLGLMTAFHEIRFPDNIAYGATGGPDIGTNVNGELANLALQHGDLRLVFVN
jgi:hypothetical protein